MDHRKRARHKGQGHRDEPPAPPPMNEFCCWKCGQTDVRVREDVIAGFTALLCVTCHNELRELVIASEANASYCALKAHQEYVVNRAAGSIPLCSLEEYVQLSKQIDKAMNECYELAKSACPHRADVD